MAGEALRINPNDLTIGDLEDFEDICGMPFSEAFKTKLDANGQDTGMAMVTAKALKAVVYVAKRKANPDFTLEDAAKVKVSELVMDLGVKDIPPPGAAG